jgi:hypothetical protein
LETRRLTVGEPPGGAVDPAGAVGRRRGKQAVAGDEQAGDEDRRDRTRGDAREQPRRHRPDPLRQHAFPLQVVG